MKRIYSFVFTEKEIDLSNDGTSNDALKALHNGDLSFDDLLYLSKFDDFELNITVEDKEL